MKRIYIPLFEFSVIEGVSFRFSSCPFIVERFECDPNRIRALTLSEANQAEIRGVEWALRVDLDDYKKVNSEPLNDRVQNDVNLLLLIFRLLNLGPCPLIRYMLSNSAEELPIVLFNAIQKNLSEDQMFNAYDHHLLSRIDSAYAMLEDAYSWTKYARARNAIYFAFLATRTEHWIQAFVFWISALEALFSNDGAGAATQTIVRRVTAYINSAKICTRNDMKTLYEIRSRIVHGDICAGERPPDENLRYLRKIDRIARECFSKLIESNDLKKYWQKSDRNAFLKNLDKNSQHSFTP